MEDTINPIAAKKMREAMKRVNDTDADGVDMIRGDHVEVRSYPGGKHERLLVIFKDGEPVASTPIVNSTFKRLKREWIWWNDLQSGMMTAYRQHGSKERGF